MKMSKNQFTHDAAESEQCAPIQKIKQKTKLNVRSTETEKANCAEAFMI